MCLEGTFKKNLPKMLKQIVKKWPQCSILWSHTRLYFLFHICSRTPRTLVAACGKSRKSCLWLFFVFHLFLCFFFCFCIYNCYLISALCKEAEKEVTLLGLPLTFLCCPPFAIFIHHLPTMCLLLDVETCILLLPAVFCLHLDCCQLLDLWHMLHCIRGNIDFSVFDPHTSILFSFSMQFGRQVGNTTSFKFQSSYASLCIQLFSWLTKDHGQTILKYEFCSSSSSRSMRECVLRLMQHYISRDISKASFHPTHKALRVKHISQFPWNNPLL